MHDEARLAGELRERATDRIDGVAHPDAEDRLEPAERGEVVDRAPFALQSGTLDVQPTWSTYITLIGPASRPRRLW